MKKGFKKFFTMALATVLAASTLTACTEKGDAQKNGSQKGSKAGSMATSGIALNDAGTYPIVKDGKLELSVFTLSMPKYFITVRRLP